MGSKPQAPTVTQTNSTKLGPEQQQVFNSAMPFIQQYANSSLPTLPTNTIAGFNPNEVAAQSSAVNAATGQGNALGNSAFNSAQFLLNPDILSPTSNPYLQQSGDAIARTMGQQLTEQVLPQLRAGSSMSSGPYAGGNTRSGIAEGLAAGRTAQSTGDALTNLYSGAYGQGLNTMLQAQQNVPLTQQSLLFGSNVQGQVGGQQRALEQAQLDQTNQLQLLQQQLPFLRAQDLLGLMQGMPGASGVTSVTGAVPQTSPLQSAIGGAALGSTFGRWGTVAGGGAGALLNILGLA